MKFGHPETNKISKMVSGKNLMSPITEGPVKVYVQQLAIVSHAQVSITYHD